MAVASRMEMRSRQVGRVTGSATVWPWLAQRITGVVLVVLMAVHIGVNHFGNLDKPGVRDRERELIVFSDVAHRMAMVGWWILDIALLAFVLYHGLNGLRNIALDLGVKSTGDKVVSSLLVVIGIAAFAFGMGGLIAFRRYG